MSERKMKNSGVEWIGQIPKDWNILKNKNIIKLLYSGGTPSSGDSDYYTEQGIPFVTISDMSNLENIYSTKSYLSNKGLASKKLKIMPKGTIIYSIYATIGVVAELEMDATINQALLAIKINEKIYDKNYYKFNLKAMRDYIFFSASKNTQYNLNAEKVKNFILVFPPKKEQIKIANFLNKKCSEIDTLKADIEEQIKILEEYKKSIITEAVTKGLDPDVEMKDSGIEWIGEIPQDWEIIKVKNVGEYRNGLTYSPQNITDETNGILVLRSSNVQKGKLVFDDNVYVNSNIKSDSMVKKGDILICSRNGSKELIGKNAIIDNDINASFGAFMMIFRCNCPEYMYYILNSSIFSYYLGTFLTSTINQLTGNNFGNMKIVFCNDKTKQQEIVDYLNIRSSEIDTIILEKKKQLETLDQYKKSLIYEYVTGKKEVSENI